ELLDGMIRMAREKHDMMDADDQITKDYFSRTNSFGKFSSDSYSESNPSSCCSTPVTPTSILQELTRGFTKAKKIASVSYSTSPLLLSLRVQAVGKLNPIDVKHLGPHFSHVAAFNSTSLDKNSKLTEEETEPKTEARKSLGRTNGATNEEASDSSTKFTIAITAATATSTTIATQEFSKGSTSHGSTTASSAIYTQKIKNSMTTTATPPPLPPLMPLRGSLPLLPLPPPPMLLRHGGVLAHHHHL
ncbi:hypothetical protein PanWU01x14_221020, partial [Parasponia andersonii]